MDELALSEGVKRLKPMLLKRIVDQFNMTQCIIFCRTNLDCDNLEKFFTAVGGGKPFRAGACVRAHPPFVSVAMSIVVVVVVARVEIRIARRWTVQYHCCGIAVYLCCAVLCGVVRILSGLAVCVGQIGKHTKAGRHTCGCCW